VANPEEEKYTAVPAKEIWFKVFNFRQTDTELRTGKNVFP